MFRGSHPWVQAADHGHRDHGRWSHQLERHPCEHHQSERHPSEPRFRAARPECYHHGRHSPGARRRHRCSERAQHPMRSRFWVRPTAEHRTAVHPTASRRTEEHSTEVRLPAGRTARRREPRHRASSYPAPNCHASRSPHVRRSAPAVQPFWHRYYEWVRPRPDVAKHRRPTVPPRRRSDSLHPSDLRHPSDCPPDLNHHDPPLQSCGRRLIRCRAWRRRRLATDLSHRASRTRPTCRSRSTARRTDRLGSHRCCCFDDRRDHRSGRSACLAFRSPAVPSVHLPSPYGQPKSTKKRGLGGA